MGQMNFVIEGISGTGKTSVCDELLRRGYDALHGDRELRPDIKNSNSDIRAVNDTAASLGAAARVHREAIWDEGKVMSQINDRVMQWSFFCGGFRNHAQLITRFDGVFIHEVDRRTLMQRLEKRPYDEFGGKPEEKKLILSLHRTKADMPIEGTVIDATAPIQQVVDEIVAHCVRMSAS